MKVARFSQGDDVRFGVLDGPELIVLKGHPIVNGYEPSGERVPVKEVKLLAPSIPSKIVCVGKTMLRTSKKWVFRLTQNQPCF